MIHFGWPWILLLLPLPWLVWRLGPAAAVPESAALRVPFADEFTRAAEESQWRARWPLWVAVLSWVLLVLAAARPQWLGERVTLPVSGRDLMLAVDLSGSMAEEDFVIEGRRVDRLTATKWVAGDFIRRREGDRIGLVLFGERAYLQAPLTFDRDTVTTLLNEAVIGLAGRSTAIGDAIGLAIKRLREKQSGDRVLVLITDGANTAGSDPLRAAQLAAGEELKIYTIGIGAEALIVNSLLGQRRINPSAELDEGMLTAIAEATGGRYFRARDAVELQEIYRTLDELEPVEQDELTFRPRTTLYPWPLAAALLLTTALLLVRSRGRLAW